MQLSGVRKWAAAVAAVAMLLPAVALGGERSVNAAIQMDQYPNQSGTFQAFKYKGGQELLGSVTVEVERFEGRMEYLWDERYADGADFFIARYFNAVTDEGAFELGYDQYRLVPGDPSRLEATALVRYDEPLPIFPSGTRKVGDLWGGAFVERRLSPTTGAQMSVTTRVYQYAILGVEDVEVGGTVYEDCLKVARFRGNQSDRVTWYAKGFGPVKYVFAQTEYSFSVPGSGLVTLTGYNRKFERVP